MRDLTSQQAAFVDAYVGGPTGVAGNATQAALAAGYSEKSSRVIAQGLLAKAHVQQAILDSSRSALARMAPAAVGILAHILADGNAPMKLRLEASKTVLDRVGLVAQAQPCDPREKPLSALTLDELADAVRDSMGGPEAAPREPEKWKPSFDDSDRLKIAAARAGEHEDPEGEE